MKALNPEEKQLLALAILKVLDANKSRFGIGLDAVTMHVGGRFGFDNIEAGQVEAELDGLIGRGFVLEGRNKLNPSKRVWLISEDGREILKIDEAPTPAPKRD